MTGHRLLSTDLLQLVAHARVASASFAKWIDDTLDPFASASYPLELAAWRKELDRIRSLVENPDRVRIALVAFPQELNAKLRAVFIDYPTDLLNPASAFHDLRQRFREKFEHSIGVVISIDL
jgi:hypothetical protein